VAGFLPPSRSGTSSTPVYEVKGSGKRTSRLRLVGRLMISGKKTMTIRPLKQRRRRRTKR
jgi:hypothetical protein